MSSESKYSSFYEDETDHSICNEEFEDDEVIGKYYIDEHDIESLDVETKKIIDDIKHNFDMLRENIKKYHDVCHVMEILTTLGFKFRLFGSSVWRLMCDKQDNHDFDILIECTETNKSDLVDELQKHYAMVRLSFHEENKERIIYDFNNENEHHIIKTEHYNIDIILTRDIEHQFETINDIDCGQLVCNFDNAILPIEFMKYNEVYEFSETFENVNQKIKYYADYINTVKKYINKLYMIIQSCFEMKLKMNTIQKKRDILVFHRIRKMLSYGFKLDETDYHLVLRSFADSLLISGNSIVKQYIIENCMNDDFSTFIDTLFGYVSVNNSKCIDNKIVSALILYYLKIKKFDIAISILPLYNYSISTQHRRNKTVYLQSRQIISFDNISQELICSYTYEQICQFINIILDNRKSLIYMARSKYYRYEDKNYVLLYDTKYNFLKYAFLHDKELYDKLFNDYYTRFFTVKDIDDLIKEKMIDLNDVDKIMQAVWHKFSYYDFLKIVDIEFENMLSHIDNIHCLLTNI